MQNFKVTVNGKIFDVTVEETSKASPSPALTTEKTEKNAKAEPQLEKAKTSAPVKTDTTIEAGDFPVNAPLAGTILSVKVKPGESVKYGQVLLTLEALKMENEIVAPQAGVIKEILVNNGSVVNVGDILATLRS